jgi:hypothetical protein
MKLSEITSILAEASLPTVSRDQLLELAGTHAGKQFQAALLGFAGGDRQRRDEIEATVRVLDPTVRDTLRRLGSTSTVDQVVAMACREQRRFFEALDAIAQRSPRAGAARLYLAELGMVPVAPAPHTDAVGAAPYYSFKIVSTGAALCIAEAQTRATKQYTVNVEGAIALPSAGPKTFDWPNKIIVQLTGQEAYQTLALFENKLPAVKFDGHGPKHDKSLHIEFQQSHYFVRLLQRGRQAVAVPVRPVDAIPFKALLYKQLLRNEPHLRIDDIREMLVQMASMTSR